MSRRVILVSAALTVVALLIGLVLVAPTPALAADTVTYSFSGRNADAGSWIEHPDGGYDSILVWGGALSNKLVGSALKPERMRGMFGFFYQEKYRPATDTEPERYWVLVVNEAPATFSANNKLTTAKLSFAAPAQLLVWCDEMPWECEPSPEIPDEWICPEPDEVSEVDVAVNISWTGFGPLSRVSYISKGRTEGFFYIERFNSLSRQANASGSVVDGDGTIYFEGAFDFAGIYDNKSGAHLKTAWDVF